MKIAILGAGFTGLSAALKLLEPGHQVEIFEKEPEIGGLAAGFSQPDWDWTLEKAYHHWFTSDETVLNLAKKLKFPVIVKRPSTDVFIRNKALAFDSPQALLTFPYLPLVDRLRTGLGTLYLKIINDYHSLEGKKAVPWIRKFMGEKSYDLIWEPLLRGKFSQFSNDIALTWFWARIKKRTSSLAYPEGGFAKFLERLGSEVQNQGAKINFNSTVSKLTSSSDGVKLTIGSQDLKFDRVLVTLPTPIFSKISPDLPNEYIKNINSIPHLFAQNLILVLNKSFMKKTYWLNVTEKSWPFLVLAEHTNFMNPSHYGNQHILYIGNYLPQEHAFLKKSSQELLKIFDPYLKKINPDYKKSLLKSYLFVAPFAQPVVTPDYLKYLPASLEGKSAFKTPLKNVYIANLDMVYPWDRGTNYAAFMGQQVAQVIDENS